jgi:hypothetical protein
MTIAWVARYQDDHGDDIRIYATNERAYEIPDEQVSRQKPLRSGILRNDDAWADEYEPGELIDLRIDQLPPHRQPRRILSHGEARPGRSGNPRSHRSRR